MSAVRSTDDKKSAKNVIQVRADDELLERLMVFSERLHVPVSSLVRSWIIDRLDTEISKEAVRCKAWQNDRLDQLKTSCAGAPCQILHLLPLTPELSLMPENISLFRGFLNPASGAQEFDERINLLGFKTQSLISSAYVQVFNTGQIESVRYFAPEQQSINGHIADDDLVKAITSYCKAYQHLKLPLPVLVCVSYLGLAGIRINQHSRVFEDQFFCIQDKLVSNWEEVQNEEVTAKTIKPLIDQFWNAAGLPKSGTYSEDGLTWYGALASLL